MAKKAASFAALGGLVFSTDAGRHCPDCRQPVDSCTCKQTLIPEGDGIARVRRESKGRGGKTVTTITGVPLAEEALKELATTLKKRCGTGGALKDGVIEIQGDHVELLLAELIKLGYKSKITTPFLQGWRSLKNENDDLPVRKVDPTRRAEFRHRSGTGSVKTMETTVRVQQTGHPGGFHRGC